MGPGRSALVFALLVASTACAPGTLDGEPAQDADGGVAAALPTVTWDPLHDAYLDRAGEIEPLDPHIQRGGTFLESWAIERYGRPDAAIVPGHTHVFPQPWDDPDPYGNPTEHERQHAFGETLNGIYVRLATRGPFDLVSIRYRARHDDDPTHVSAIPGADPSDVEIWIATELRVPTTAWHRHPTHVPFDVDMHRWVVLRPGDVRGVRGVFITSTGNVSIDDVVLRPR